MPKVFLAEYPGLALIELRTTLKTTLIIGIRGLPDVFERFALYLVHVLCRSVDYRWDYDPSYRNRTLLTEKRKKNTILEKDFEFKLHFNRGHNNKNLIAA